MTTVHYLITAGLAMVIGMTVKDDKPEYGIPLICVLILHVIAVVAR